MSHNNKNRCERHRLRVHIWGAKGLRAADISFIGKGKSDPFCRCQVRGRPATKYETAVIKKTLDPEWNESCTMDGVKNDDVLDFEVFDHDQFSKPDRLGRVSLPFDRYFGEGFDGELPLEDTEKAISKLFIRIEVLQKLNIHKSDTRAFVKVVDGKRLRSADFGGSSDPYCVVQIPGKPRSKFQTKVLYQTLEPVWNEEDELLDYAEDDPIHFEVFDYDLIGSPDSLGYAVLPSDEFHPYGYKGPIMLESAGGKTGQAYLNVEVDVEVPPPPPEPQDPLSNVTSAETQRIPFQLRSLETNKVHKLRGYTQIGRSKKLLDLENDLIISQMSGDVGRKHAHIKATLLPDQCTWLLRIYDENGAGGLGQAEGGGHAGTGTSVDGNPVDPKIGTAISPGSILRFGKQEIWTVECSALVTRSEKAVAAQSRALILAEDDPSCMRDLHVPSIACHEALQSCKDWISLVRVTLEWLNEPDEPPCVDSIEVTDELARTASVHYATTFEEQKVYDVKKILRDVRLGTTVRLRLCSDPFLLAPVLNYLEQLQKWLEEKYETHTYS